MKALPDRSALAGLRSSLFLFRQPFLLYPALLATVAWAALLLVMSERNGKLTAETALVMLFVSVLCGFGVAVLFALPAFLAVRAFGPKIEPSFEDGESRFLDVPANHFLGDEGRGGRLYVTDRRALFVPHRFNVQLATVEQRWDRVEDLQWARVVGAGGAPLSSVLEIVERERVERYVVRDAVAIGRVIEGALGAGPA